MKLAALYNRTSIIIAITLLVVASVSYYLTISYFAAKILERSLTEEAGEVVMYVHNNQKLPTPFNFDEDHVSFIPIGDQYIQTYFTDTPYYNRESETVEGGRAIVTIISLNKRNYKVTIIESQEETEDMVTVVGLTTAALCLLLIAALFFANRYILNRLWQPFYALLARLKTFSVADEQKIGIQTSKIDEFNELQDAFDTMQQSVKKDYQILKTFTENASHEMMTPIAVITSKLDTLIQDDSLTADQFELLHQLYTATGKMAKLNQALLLLVKIDNQLITDTVVLDLQQILIAKFAQFHDIIKAKQITLRHNLTAKSITANAYLVDILLNNLLNNAIRHNVANGQIKVTLTEVSLVFENTGKPEALDAEKIFERFAKGKLSEGTGLGLTIARNICINYGFKMQYSFADGMHRFTVVF